MSIYFTDLSAGRVAPMILSLLCCFFFLYKRKSKDLGSFWFSLYFGFLFVFNFGYWFGYSIFHPIGSYGWLFACAIAFAALSRLQISYSFPSEVFKKERVFVLGVGCILATFAFLDYAFRFSATLGFSFSLHAYGSKFKSIWIPIFSFIAYLYSIVVSIRRLLSSYSQRRQVTSMQSQLAGNRNEVSLTIWLILLTTIELILTGIYFLGHTRLLDAVILAEIMNSGILVIFSGYVILYTSSTTGRTGFIPRLLGMSLVFFLIVSTLQSRYYEFLFRNSILQQVYDTTVETIAIPELEMEQIRLQAEVQHIGNYSHFFFEREGNFFIALRMLDGNEWKIFHYLKYRESIHSLILPSVWFQICLSILVLLFFPIFFKESFLLPIQQLMEEIKLEFQGIESGDSPKSFEFGVLRNALFRIADMIQKAKKDLPEVSETFDFLESYLSSKPKTLEIGNTSLVYKSSIFEKTIQKVEQAARFPHPVTITGETGSGKELAARMIHQLGENKNGPFVAVNCATLPENLWEAEIFGAKKGSFTDAKVDRKGRIQEADGGSLFFDEIGEMPLPIQAKMLRLLQEKTYTPLGANKEHIANCRFIFATNQNLSEMVEKKLFREDLLYRIQVFNIPLNPLRDRKEDIPYLWDFFTESFCNEYKMTKPKISQNAFRAILQYPWPGNIREMQNTVIQTLTQSPKELIEESDLPFLRTLRNDRDNHAFSLPRGLKLEEELEQLSKDRILQALELEKGNMTKAALRLGLKRTTLRYKMKDLGILD